MGAVPQFDKEEFVSYVMSQFRTILPRDVEVKKVDNETLDIKYGDERSYRCFLGNVWKKYYNSGDIDVVREFLEVNKNITNTYTQVADKTLMDNKNYIYPVIRHKNFGLEIKPPIKNFQNKKVGVLSSPLCHEFKYAYIVDTPYYIYYITEDMLKHDNLSKDWVIETAKKNLLKQKWLKPIEVVNNEIGKLMIFHNEESQFQSQFFEKQLIERNIGKYFYFSIPTNKCVLVFVPKNIMNPSTLIGMQRFKALTVSIYSKEPYEISPTIYSYRDKEFHIIG